jgi:quinol-cytochrome oxidoreductase complex cytochrome b subunit
LLFLSIKKTKLLIIKDILDKIITFRPYKANINVDTVFIIAFAGFLYIEEIIYLNRKAKDFSTTRALYSDVRIAPNGYLMVFYFK